MTGRAGGATPELLRGQAGAFCQGFEFGPGHPLGVEDAGAYAAVGAGATTFSLPTIPA